MTLSPFASLLGGIPFLVTPADPAGGTMGAMVLGLLALTALVLVASGIARKVSGSLARSAGRGGRESGAGKPALQERADRRHGALRQSRDQRSRRVAAPNAPAPRAESARVARVDEPRVPGATAGADSGGNTAPRRAAACNQHEREHGRTMGVVAG
jgi:hypothetical protein